MVDGKAENPLDSTGNFEMHLDATQAEIDFADRLIQLIIGNTNTRAILEAIDAEPIPEEVGTHVGKVLKWTAFGAVMMLDADAKLACEELAREIIQTAREQAIKELRQSVAGKKAPAVIIALASRRH